MYNSNDNKQNTLPSPPLHQHTMTSDQQKFCGAIIRNLKRHRDAAPFLKPVDYVKLNVPDYPNIVQHPMDLTLVDAKLTAKEYNNVEEFISDVRLIFNNCFKFNGPEAMISVLCQNVESAFEKSLRQMPPSNNMIKSEEVMISKEPSPPLSQHNSPPPTEDMGRPKREIHCPSKDYPETFTTQRKLSLANKTTQMKYCFGVIREFKKNKYRDQMYPFLYPVDPIALNIPDYFTIIKHPMDLSTIENKLLNDEYKNPQQFAQDVQLMFNNCYLYNPPTLPIYTAAQQMEKVFNDKWEQRPLEDVKKTVKKTQKRRVSQPSEDDEKKEEQEEDMQLAELERHLQTITQQIESMKKPTNKKSSPTKKTPLKRKRTVKRKTVSSDEEESDEESDIYTHEQKVVLSEVINGLSHEKLNGVVEIIQANMPTLQGNGNNEIELDMESMDTKTLFQLHNYVFPDNQIYYKQQPEPKRRGRKPNPNKQLGTGKKQKREHLSEVATERQIKALEATLDKFKKHQQREETPSSSESESEDEDGVSGSSSSSDSD